MQNSSFSETYQYDRFGNLTGKNGTVDYNIHPQSNHFISSNARKTKYDIWGNLVHWLAERYEYDRFNMLTRYQDDWDAAKRTIDRRYVYTADDERIGVLEPGEPATWRPRGLDGKVLREFRHDPEPSEGWSWQTDWVHRGSQLLAANHADHGWRHFHLDHLGTPRVVTDSGGAVKSRHDYWPYGEEVTSPTIEVMKFTGHERDVHGGAPPAPMGPQGPTCSQVELVDQVVSGSGTYIDCDDAFIGPGVTFTETAEVSIEAADDVIFDEFVIESGSKFSMTSESSSASGGGGDPGGAGASKTLDYMHARYYRPGLGRFLSTDPDPESVSFSRPQSWNKYTYVLNNPLVYIDPYGERWFNVDDQWVFFEDTKYIEQVTVGEDGNTTSQQVEGLESLVTFDGGTLTLFQANGSTLAVSARAGRPHTFGNPARFQGQLNIGPIPEGTWSFRPGEIQSYSSTSLWDRIKGLGPFGTWPGGVDAWGQQRVWLSPEPGTNTRGRSGFTIHGGANFGSRGCVDLCSRASDFFSTVDRTLDKIPVYVDYPDN